MGDVVPAPVLMNGRWGHRDLSSVDALRRHARPLAASGGLGTTVSGQPAAGVDSLTVHEERAAHHIASPASINVAGHARTRGCDFMLVREDGALRNTPCGDGIGLPAVHREGVGLWAMRDRPAELGGGYDWRTGAAGGTHFDCRLPTSER